MPAAAATAWGVARPPAIAGGCGRWLARGGRARAGATAARAAWVLVVLVGARAAFAATGDVDGLVAFAPPNSEAARRGRQVAARFDLGRRFELRLQINNAFTGQNRIAIARAEAAIASVPGVRKVTGPAGLLALGTDTGGRLTVGPLLGAAQGDDADEAARQRVLRRSDAVGWFLSREGTEIRLLVDTDDVAAVEVAIEAAASSSGLVLLSGSTQAHPLWPDPAREPRPFSPWLPFLVVAAVLALPALVVAGVARPGLARAMLAAGASGLAAAAPALLAPAPKLRWLALGAGVAAAALVLLLVLLFRLRRLRGGRSARRESVPPVLLIVALAAVVAGAVSFPRVFIGTQLWRETPTFFVSVRGSLDEPIVLRELRRLTDFLRALPGVAHAWSIADLFSAVPRPGEDVAGVPDTAAAVRVILTRARDDAAVRLELAADHNEALVGVRLDGDSGVDPLAVLRDLDRYLAGDFRASLVRIDVSDRRVPPTTRGFGRAILAADATVRMLRICARAGRNLDEDEAQLVERVARRAALLPIVELPKLKGELAREIDAFLGEAAAVDPSLPVPRAADRVRLADELARQPVDATVADVAAPLRAAWGRRVSDATVATRAAELRRRLMAARRRHSARIDFDEILSGADLPTEGVLSEEIRQATLDAMGPVVGVPVPRGKPGAYWLDAAATGGLACDGALSQAWRPRLGWGIAVDAVAMALLLGALGGWAAILWWPAALAPGALLIVVPAVAALPIGALYVSALAGALAGGAAFAVAFAPRRGDP